jgi:hypothetical protein
MPVLRYCTKAQLLEAFADRYGSAMGLEAARLSAKLDAWTKEEFVTDDDIAAMFGKEAQAVKDRAAAQSADLAKVEQARGEVKEAAGGADRLR